MKRSTLIASSFCAVLLLGFALGHFRAPSSAVARQPLYYVDPMHPAYKSDKPGIAPDCGMQLVPVYAEDLRKSALSFVMCFCFAGWHFSPSRMVAMTVASASSLAFSAVA